ncbi:MULTISPECIES: hypothetical protein [unclassified Gordonia (in: high G+C Gram-positive bacteria)]|uniref:hypothetical protein n=1 Tax=unclassified Gordonia (in: high G+C Gram-positive bacteria) TaxID=2657482 RepID=UPI0009ACDBD4|nr:MULTISPECIES: hypothetical protein [unclassified Gordonia (in: high G+C Gram-positive bacteria)]MDF3280697.1 hypothetical protein [Gordonia sp. N1V]OPX12310.1 hypothetical protein B1964_21640 [Gordonia sp. i37]
MSAPDTTTQAHVPDPNEGDAPTIPVSRPAPATEPAAAAQPAAAGGPGIPSKTKNAIIAGGIGLAVGFGLLGFGAGYVVGDSGSSTTQQQFPGGGNGQFPGGGTNGGGMNGGGMNGQMPGGGNGQFPGGGNGQMPGGTQNGQTPGQQNGQTPGGQTAAPTQTQSQTS